MEMLIFDNNKGNEIKKESKVENNKTLERSEVKTIKNKELIKVRKSEKDNSKIYSDMFKSLQNLQIYGLAKPSTVLNLLYELTGKNESISRYNLDDYFIQFNFKNSGMNKKLMSISVEKGDKIIYESKGFTEKYTAIPDKGEMKKLLEKIEKIKINSNKNVDNNTITNIYRM